MNLITNLITLLETGYNKKYFIIKLITNRLCIWQVITSLDESLDENLDDDESLDYNLDDDESLDENLDDESLDESLEPPTPKRPSEDSKLTCTRMTSHKDHGDRATFHCYSQARHDHVSQHQSLG